LINDVSASTGAFVRTVCLIAVCRSVSGRTVIIDVGELVELESYSPRNWAANSD